MDRFLSNSGGPVLTVNTGVFAKLVQQSPPVNALSNFKKRHHIYEWVNEIPLNGTKDADDVNYFYYRLVEKGEITYCNSWVTDIVIDENNVIHYYQLFLCCLYKLWPVSWPVGSYSRTSY